MPFPDKTCGAALLLSSFVACAIDRWPEINKSIRPINDMVWNNRRLIEHCVYFIYKDLIDLHKIIFILLPK